MLKYFFLVLGLLIFADAFSVGRPVTIIRCVERADSDVFAKESARALKALDSTNITNRFCYPGLIAFDVSSYDCQDPNIASSVITVKITGDTLMIGDALTINSIVNASFTDGSSDLAGDFDPMAPVGTARIAVVSVTAGEIEIEFTRDPSQETVITFRNAQTADMTGELRIPACDPADLAIGNAARIPTLGEWSVIILSFLMLIIGVIAYKEGGRATLVPVRERVRK